MAERQDRPDAAGLGEELALPCGHTLCVAGELKMGDLRRWVKAERDANIDMAYQMLARLIQAWTFDGDPKTMEAYDELTISQWQEINAAVSEWLKGSNRAKV